MSYLRVLHVHAEGRAIRMRGNFDVRGLVSTTGHSCDWDSMTRAFYIRASSLDDVLAAAEASGILVRPRNLRPPNLAVVPDADDIGPDELAEAVGPTAMHLWGDDDPDDAA